MSTSERRVGVSTVYRSKRRQPFSQDVVRRTRWEPACDRETTSGRRERSHLHARNRARPSSCRRHRVGGRLERSDGGDDGEDQACTAIDPEKCAGGAGWIEVGPTSMRYVPSASKVPSARMVGRENWPCPHPTARLHPVSVTERQAPSPVHRPVASSPSPGPVGLLLQASRQVPATSAATSTRAGRGLMPRYNAAACRQDQKRRDQ